MRIEEVGKKCTGCMACINACKSGAIIKVPGVDGFFYPQISETQCTNCGLCAV